MEALQALRIRRTSQQQRLLSTRYPKLLRSREPGQRTRFSGIPVARSGDKPDIANAVVFLFSSAASFVSGAVHGASEHVRSPQMQMPYPLTMLHPPEIQGTDQTKALNIGLDVHICIMLRVVWKSKLQWTVSLVLPFQ